MTGKDRFKSKIALVTGASRGIGRAIALRLGEEGASVVIHYHRREEKARETAQSLEPHGAQTLVARANLGNLEEIDGLFDEIVDAFGGVDIFISNAATGSTRPALEQPVRAWERTLNVNARAFLYCVQRAAPLMQARGGGHIVSLSSPGSSRVIPNYSITGTSKAALESLTRYLAIELAPMGIVVNGVSPGVVDTDALRSIEAALGRDVRGTAQSGTPAGRLVSPEDVAGVVAFLCSPEAEMIRGQVIAVDGGYTLPVGPLDPTSSSDA